MAAQRAALLLSCYRRNEATDPDAYVAAVTLMLAQYPEYIVDRVTDPRRGLPSKSPFLPSAFDVRTECERLMGFPVGWTALDGATDSQRWQVLGDSMVVPVMRWIGERIQGVDDIVRRADPPPA